MSNQEAINVMEKYTAANVGISKVVIESHNLAIAALKRNQWIPVSERLPAEPDNVFDDDGCIDWDKTIECNVTIAEASRATSLYYLGGDQWADHEGRLYQVIAWMPLPAAYKPEN